jgi:hypothetical protein
MTFLASSAGPAFPFTARDVAAVRYKRREQNGIWFVLRDSRICDRLGALLPSKDTAGFCE